MTQRRPTSFTRQLGKFSVNTLLACILATPSVAFSAERTLEKSQAISINADQLLVQEKQGISRYQGNVEVTQGELQLNGEQIKIIHPNNQLQSIEISGKPATFKRVDEKSGNVTQGHAQKILYQSKTDTLTFIGDALVEEAGKHKISGAKLVYDLQKQTLQAESSSQNNERVQVILVPNSATE
ncbi:lipopolysaccharide transport periplasmic protein LptA [Thiomicrorhabdus sp. 6S2-11]|uniref:Lipopolysaccharide export system protein LptA n=1 Tax=Thiomicrorhabdus marina TaxID=2818442 RepID=A0ABS3Q1Z6_9GAMM|nr:lipopolysaccharide transport periplasmic protein LptA [Thiomicrorhabdus marina]MBO1926296.1 lipopolysaccharide transport periplasmic protein LptA [Thiomicrorhabdus marina]